MHTAVTSDTGEAEGEGPQLRSLRLALVSELSPCQMCSFQYPVFPYTDRGRMDIDGYTEMNILHIHLQSSKNDIQ